MSLWYDVLYKVGVTPWEEDPPNSMVSAQVSSLFDREEEGREAPFGRVLDLGCGSGIWSVALAKRGWQVTGVDIVPKAVRMARERARIEDVNANFVVGDVTTLHAAGVGSGFNFVVDFECFNHLNEKQRQAVGREVSAVTAPDATMLMLAWEPGRRWLLPPGADRRDIETAFADWSVVNDHAYAAQEALPFWLKRIDLRFYRLRRHSAVRRAKQPRSEDHAGTP